MELGSPGQARVRGEGENRTGVPRPGSGREQTRGPQAGLGSVGKAPGGAGAAPGPRLAALRRRGGGGRRAGPGRSSRWLRSAPRRSVLPAASPASPLRSPPPQRGPAAAKTPRAVLRVKNGAAKLAKPPAAAGETPGGAPGAGLFMERSQSRLSLSASFEALAIYFPCMNSFDEEDAGTGPGWVRSGGGGARGCVRRGRCGQARLGVRLSALSPTPLGLGFRRFIPGDVLGTAGEGMRVPVEVKPGSVFQRWNTLRLLIDRKHGLFADGAAHAPSSSV